MSVIFRTLKKLGNFPGHKQGEGAGVQGKTIGQLSGTTFRLPRSVLCASVLIIVLGLVVTCAAHFFGNRLADADKAQVLPESKGTANRDLPQPSTWTAEYQAPRSEDMPGFQGRAIDPGPESIPTPTQAAASYQPDREPLPDAADKAVEPGLTTVEKIPSISRYTSSLPGVEHTGDLSGRSPDSEAEMDARLRRIHRVNLEKSARIGGLVSRIKRSMAAGDLDQAKELIDQLAVFKGEENSYVQKLRAFRHMRQGDLAPAASLLTAVLEKNADDFDAGFNMAVIEIRMNRMDDARKRLAALRDAWPENTAVAKLFRVVNDE